MQITRHAEPAEAGDEHDLFELDAKLWDGVLLELFGDTDLGTSARRRRAEAASSPYRLHCSLKAADRGRPVGVAMIDLPLVDNRDVALISVAVDPLVRRQGIGSALLDAALDWARQLGRNTFQAFTWDRLTERGSSTVSARDGDGAIDPTAAGASFLLHRDFVLAQVDVMSALRLPPQRALADAAIEATASMPGDYALIQWRGGTPAARQHDLASLMMTMSTDMPLGEASFEKEAYDEERIRHLDAVLVDAGVDQLVTCALHRPTGRLVGFTRIVHDAARPHVADQWDTLVVGAHRGNRLGLAMKSASHATLRDTWPSTVRVVTGNASENAWMLDINRRLGFAPVAASGWFERREGLHGAV